MRSRWGAVGIVVACSPNAKFEQPTPPTPCITTTDCAPGEACDGFDIDSGTSFCESCSALTPPGCCKADGGVPAGSPCTSNADCSAAQMCVFAIGDCAGAATCQDDYCGACPLFVQFACTCSGHTISIGCGTTANGFWSVPVASYGACTGDAGLE